MNASNPENTPSIIVMHGDETGEELLQEALRVLHPSVIRQPLNFIDYDLSLENRRATRKRPNRGYA